MRTRTEAPSTETRYADTHQVRHLARYAGYRRAYGHYDLTILHEDPDVRHLRFGAPQAPGQSFTILVWDGYLAIREDRQPYWVFDVDGDPIEFFSTTGYGPGMYPDGTPVIDVEQWGFHLAGHCSGRARLRPRMAEWEVTDPGFETCCFALSEAVAAYRAHRP